MNLRNLRWRVPFLLLLTLLLSLGIGLVAAQAASISVGFDNMEVSSEVSQVSIPIKITGLSDANTMEGLYLEVAYDQAKLEYSGLEAGSDAPAFQYFGNVQGSTLIITGFAASAVKANGEILKLKFNVKDRGNPLTFSVNKCEVNDALVEVKNGTITFKDSQPQSKLKVSYSDLRVGAEEENFVLPVKIQGLTNDNTLEGLLLKLTYDSSKLSYTGVEAGAVATGFQYFDNASNNTVIINGFTTSPVKADGEILRIKFKVIKRVNPIEVSLNSVQVNDLDVIYASGKITLEEKAPITALGLASFTVNGNKVTVTNPDQLSYSVKLDTVVSELDIKATQINKDDLVQTTKTGFDSNGIATVTIKVMSAQDNTQIKTYTVTVIAKKLSGNSDLKYIMVNGKKLPSFNKGKLSYDYPIADCIKNLTVKAPPEDATSTVRISGATLGASGIAQVQIAVIAEDGTTKTYTVKITSENEPDFVIVGMNPGEEETNIPVDTNVVIDFSQALNPETVDENSVYILNQNGTAIPVKVKLSMDKKTVTIDPVSDLAEEYEYTVVVSTRLYSLKDEQSFSADVQWMFKTGIQDISPVVIPNKPTNLKGTATSSFSITWSWQDASDNENGFLLKDENGKTIVKIDRANTTVYVEKGLSPNTQYKRTVSAYVMDDLDNMVESEASLPKTEKTLAYKVKPLVVYAKVTEITSEKIVWRWYKKGEPGVIVKIYDKNMNEVGQVSQTSQKYEDNINIDKNDKEFTRIFTVYDPTMNLESQATTVSIVNPYYGTGKSLNIPLIKTSSLRDGKITITIKDRSRDEQGFRIFRVNAAGQIQEMVKEVLTSDVEGINKNIGVEIDGLDPDVIYRYFVKAYNQIGEGEASDIVSVNE